MKVQYRKILGNPARAVFICETEEESEILDKVFGNKVKEDGFISETKGQVKLSDGYGEHYVQLGAS